MDQDDQGGRDSRVRAKPELLTLSPRLNVGSGREMAAWIGLVPKQNSTGGKERIGRISKQGDQYLRWLLVAGAMTIIRHAKRKGTTNLPWLAAIIARRPTKVAAVALANKIARIAWVLLTHGGTYQRPATGAA